MTWKQLLELNLRDLGGIPLAQGTVPHGQYMRSAKLSTLSPKQCEALCRRYHIGCVIDLRTALEAEEYPDPLPDGVRYVQLPLLADATLGITREKGSDPMRVIRSMRKEPQRLLKMIPDFEQLYRSMVTDPYSRAQLQQVVALLRDNARQGIATLFHCTAGKDRTGVVAMALLTQLGADREAIVRDYLKTNRSAYLPTLRKSLGVWLLTGNLQLAKAVWQAFLVRREFIEAAMEGIEN